MKNIKVYLSDVEKDYQERKSFRMEGVPFGINGLDKITLGLKDSELVLVAGRQGNGAINFALNIIRNASIVSNYKVALLSLKNGAKSYVDQILRAQLEVVNINYDNLDGKQKEEYLKIVEAPIYIENLQSKSIIDLMEKAVSVKNLNNVDLIIIDSLQLIREPSKSFKQGESRNYEDITRLLRVLAMSLNLPIIILSHLPQSVDDRDNKVPQETDLAEYGEIGNYLDKILFVYRPEYYGIAEDEFGESTKNLLKIIVRKNHDGIQAQCDALFSNGLTKISERDFDHKNN